MTEVIEPSQSADKEPADAAWENQITQATNSLRYQVDNIQETVGSSSSVIPIYSNTQDGATQSYTPPDSGTGFVTFHSYTDELPTLPISGLVFNQYSDQPVDLVIYQYIRTANKPANPGTTSYNVSTGAYTASTNWQLALPTQDNVPTWVSQANIVGTGIVVASWSNPVLLFQAELEEGLVFYGPSSSSNPGTPSATDFNFETGAFTNLTSNWQTTPVTVGGGTTGQSQWQSRYKAELPVGQTTAIVTFQTPISFTAFGNNIQSDNFNGDINNNTAGTAGWAIGRNNGNAIFNNALIRGSLNASDINAGSLSADRIASTAINANNITAGDLSATRINGGTLTVGNVTVSGAFEAVNLVNGIVISAHGGSGGGNIISFTSANLTGVNTDAVILVSTVASAPSSGQTASANTRFEFASNNGATSPNINSGAATSHGFGGVVGMAGGKVQLNKNTAYQVRVFGSVNQDHGGSFSGSCMVLEIKR